MKLYLDERGKADVCRAIDEYGNDMKIVGYIERQQEEGISLEEAIKNAAIKYGKTEKYVKEVYEEAT